MSIIKQHKTGIVIKVRVINEYEPGLFNNDLRAGPQLSGVLVKVTRPA